MNNYKYTFLTAILISYFCCVLTAVEKKEPLPGKSLNTAGTYSRLCVEEDLYGLWKVVRWIPYFEIHGKDWNKPAFMKNQWFLFDGKGGMKSLASNKELPLDDVQRRLGETDSIVSVVFKRKGFFDISSSLKGSTDEHWRCSIAEKKMKVKAINTEILKGDIIMTMLGPNNTIKYFRQLRRVEN
jgi:hypothetical protein